MQTHVSPLRSGGYAARSQRGVLFLCFSTWGYTSLAVARWIHPRLHAAAAPQLRRLLNITPPKPDGLQVPAYDLLKIKSRENQ